MLKEKFKENDYIVEKYKQYIRRKISFLARISPNKASKYLYKKMFGRKLDLKDPKTFNEKLMYLKLNEYNNNKLVINCSDKYAVREYVTDKKCGNILNKLYGVYSNANEINWKELPQKFVLKCTHGCGFNIICTDKEKLNKKETIKKLNKWRKKTFGYDTAETHYTKIKPKIICERYLETDAGMLPNDYKIYCFNGEPKLVLTCTERASKLKLNFLDLNWKELDIGTENYKSNTIPTKPNNFQEMIEYAKKLAEPFKFVRVDFYDYNGEVIFGELTFTPAGCCAQYYNDEGNKVLGNMLKI